MQNWKVRYYSAPLCERNLAIVLMVAAIVVVVVKAVMTFIVFWKFHFHLMGTVR